MPEDQDSSVIGRIKNFLLTNTTTTNIALGAVGFFNLPLMGALIGANTAWKKSPKPNKFFSMDTLRKGFATLAGAVAGASVGIIGSAVVGIATVLGGPAGLAVGMGLTGLAASYMGKDAAQTRGPASKQHERPASPELGSGKGKAKKRENSRGQKQEKTQNKPAQNKASEQVLADAKAIVQGQGAVGAKQAKAAHASHGPDGPDAKVRG
jgi:hypothetical protein